MRRKQLKVRFYGILGEKLGSEIDIEPPAGTDTVEQLRIVLADLFPDAAGDIKERCRACIADSIVGEDHKIADTGTIEFFPPLSGG